MGAAVPRALVPDRPPRNPRQVALARGIVVGLLAAVLFLVLHAWLVEPIWVEGLRGFLPAIFGGALAGLGYHMVRDQLPGRGAVRGLLYGGLAALVLLAFVGAAVVRISGFSLLAALGFVMVPLAIVLALLYAAMRPIEGMPREEGQRRHFWGAVGILAVNAYPGFFLLRLPELVPDHVPNPWPMPLALMGLYLMAGLLLEGFASRPERVQQG